MNKIYSTTKLNNQRFDFLESEINGEEKSPPWFNQTPPILQQEIQ
jgi:hypothetical protein